MIKDISFNAIKLSTLLRAVLLAVILVFLILGFFYFVKINNTIAQTNYVIFLCSLMVIIVMSFLVLHKKIICFSFNNDKLIIHEKYTVRKKYAEKTRAVPYCKIESYNIFSIRFFTKKMCNVIRITSGKNYAYCLSWVSGNKSGEFNQDEYNRLQEIFGQNLKLRKAKKAIDIICIFSLSIVPQIFFIVAILLLIGIFWYIFSL